MADFRDIYGLLHDVYNPTPTQTTNSPLFSGTYIVFKGLNGSLNAKECTKFLDSMDHLYKNNKWHSTAVETDPVFSLDNFTGLVSALKVIIEYTVKDSDINNRAKAMLKNVPLFHRQLDHPKDFIFVGFAKYPYLFWILLPLLSIAMIYSAFRTHKYRENSGGWLTKTDGIIMALLRCHSCNLKWSWFFVDYLISFKKRGPPPPRNAGVRIDNEGNWRWENWVNVFGDYFSDPNHPNNRAVKHWYVLGRPKLWR